MRYFSKSFMVEDHFNDASKLIKSSDKRPIVTKMKWILTKYLTFDNKMVDLC